MAFRMLTDIFFFHVTITVNVTVDVIVAVIITVAVISTRTFTYYDQ